jgi:hypothetical protein
LISKIVNASNVRKHNHLLGYLKTNELHVVVNANRKVWLISEIGNASNATKHDQTLGYLKINDLHTVMTVN